jgi:hypothetical protein
MPTAERRFHLGLLVKTKKEEQEEIEKMKNKSSGGKGSRQTKISGGELKNKIKSGEVPMT